MHIQDHSPLKGLIIWVDMPYHLPEYRSNSDEPFGMESFSESDAVPLGAEDYKGLPVLPLLSVDPTSRIDKTLTDAEVWLTPHQTLNTNHYNILKFAGDLHQPDTLWLDWEDALASHRDPIKRFMLEACTHLADNGLVFVIVPNANDTFIRLWQYYLSHVAYNARMILALGPADFDWPEPIQWLAENVGEVQTKISKILADPELVKAESMVDFSSFYDPYSDQTVHEALRPGYDELEETPRMEGDDEAEDTTLRLDTAVPENVRLGELFDLAVSVRQIRSPVLLEQDLTRTQSGDIQVVWPEGQDTISLRIEVSAPTCEIAGEELAKFRLRYAEDSPVFYFQLTPKRLGSLSIIVKVYQEDFWLGSARIRTQVIDEPVGVVETTVTSRTLAFTHTDLEIRIGQYNDDKKGYPVEAQLSDGSHFDDGILALDENLLSTISHPMDYGDVLWEMLFNGPIYKAYLAASAVSATATEDRLRLRLWIDDDAPALHTLMWECLLDRSQTPPKPVSVSAKRPFSRYLGISKSVSQPLQQEPVRMLFVVSNPPDLDGLAALDVELELLNLLDVFEDQSNIQMTVLAGDSALPQDVNTRLSAGGHTVLSAPASLEEIIRTLTGRQTFHILHILAHGRYVQLRGESELYLQDNDGLMKIVRDSEISLRLGAVSPLPHLVFLAACESASRHAGNQNAFVGLAPKLVACGVPAVIAMQDMLPVDTAQKLTGDFYRYVLQHGIVDRALAQARLLLFKPSSKDWATPVLYMRLKDGLLFDLHDE